MTTKLLLTASAAALVATAAAGQTAANREGAQLLSPLTVLYNSDAGKAALQQNLAASIQVNNGANQARRDQAVSDNVSNTDGRQFTNALGSTLDAAYQKAITASNPAVVSGGAVYTALSRFTGVSGADSAFLKFYLANGTTDGTTAATGINLPSGAQFNVYDKAYGVTTSGAGQNPYGDSRPYQVAPPNPDKSVPQIDNFAAGITSGLSSNSAIPSGHTTFGTTEALLMAMAVPERFSQSVARGADYGYSRVVLGAHYALDVIAGRILATHDVAMLLNNNPAYTGGTDYQALFSNFTSSIRSVLAGYAGTDVATAAQLDTSAYSNAAQVKADAAYRLNYGIQPVGATNLPPIVPEGAEVLLATRFPYLNAVQRRDVLASTELPSGFPLDDGTGWARLDLYTAGGGYGSFSGIVTANQNAALGGLNAADIWSNDIGGTGGLVRAGTGQLTLTGANSYMGGTLVTGGTLVASSSTALGLGDVALDGGTLRVNVDGLTIGGNFSETAGSMLVLSAFDMDSLMSILGNATLGGMLVLDLGQYGERAGDYALFSWAGHSGQFGSVRLDNLAAGYTGSLSYRANGLFLNIAGAVPEPASWAMMVAGFGLLGAMLRRRRGALLPA